MNDIKNVQSESYVNTEPKIKHLDKSKLP